jgi:hypothetical protein
MEMRDHCEALAAECKEMAAQQSISNERAAALINVANSSLILAFLYERLAAIIKKENE